MEGVEVAEEATEKQSQCDVNSTLASGDTEKNKTSQLDDGDEPSAVRDKEFEDSGLGLEAPLDGKEATLALLSEPLPSDYWKDTDSQITSVRREDGTLEEIEIHGDSTTLAGYNLPPLDQPSYDIVPIGAWLRAWIRMNATRAVHILFRFNKVVRTPLATTCGDSGREFIDCQKPSVQELLRTTEKWSFEQWLGNAYLLYGFRLDRDPDMVFNFMMDFKLKQYPDFPEPPEEQFPRNKKEALWAFMRDLPELCAKFMETDAINEVTLPVARICSKMPWQDLVAHLRQGEINLKYECLPAHAVALVICGIRTEMVRAKIPWRDLEEHQVLELMMYQPRSNIRIGVGSLALVDKEMKDSTSLTIAIRLAKNADKKFFRLLKDRNAEAIGKAYRKHISSCTAPDCFCLTF